MKNILHYALVSVVLAGSATGGYCAAPIEHVYSNEEARNFRTVMSIALNIEKHKSEIENLAVDIANVLSLMDEWNGLSGAIKNSGELTDRISHISEYFGEMQNFLIAYAQKKNTYSFPSATSLPPLDKVDQNLISKELQEFQEKVNSEQFQTLFERMERFIPLIYLWNQIPENIKSVYRNGMFGIGGSKQLELPFVFTIEGLKRPLDNYCAKHPELAAGNYRYQ